MGRIAILGGTGPEGMGLGLRFALAGETVVLGSRQAERAVEAARSASARLQAVGTNGSLMGAANGEAVDGADIVVLAFPYAGVDELLPQVAPQLKARIVLDVVNPLVRHNKTFVTASVPEGSAAEAIQARLPESFVVSGFKNESAEELNAIEHPVEGDVLLCSDHPAARKTVVELVRRVPSYRPVVAGALANARALEGITALLLNVNRRYKAVTSIKLLGLADTPPAGNGNGDA